MKLGFLFEHPEWSADLIAEFRRQNVDIEAVNVAEMAFDTSSGKPDWVGAVNRINIMPSADRKPSVAFHVQHYLGWIAQQRLKRSLRSTGGKVPVTEVFCLIKFRDLQAQDF